MFLKKKKKSRSFSSQHSHQNGVGVWGQHMELSCSLYQNGYSHIRDFNIEKLGRKVDLREMKIGLILDMECGH